MPATAQHHLAIDLGASSGRAVLGSFDGATLSLRELHRFPNGPIELPTGLHWDTPRLFEEIRHSLTLAASNGITLRGMGIDTWGVDYALLSSKGELLGLPHHYRDPRTQGLMDFAFTRMPRERIYARTGIQFMALNTLYQLLAELRTGDGRLAAARTLLFTPDLLNYWLTGLFKSEHSIASTSQLYDTATSAWAIDLVSAMGLPPHILPPVAAPGTTLGPLLPALGRETGAGAIDVIAPASHDTGSAVAAVPANGDDGWAYISSGTWSLVGRELRAPIRTPQALAANFTNECGVENTIRFHKNIAGLWLLQECQRIWAAQGRTHTFSQLAELAMSAPPWVSLVDPDDPAFAGFGDMPERICAYCRRTGQPPPRTDAALARCILESLALKCRAVIETLELLSGPVSRIHMVGGGVQNTVLCQFTASATGRPVIAGPVEATAAGNVMAQLLATGGVSNLRQIREVIARSFSPVHYEPRDAEEWNRAWDRFQDLIPA